MIECIQKVLSNAVNMAWPTLLLMLVLCWLRIIGGGRQEYIPGVPIIGVDEKTTLAMARERFRKHAKEMLLEGYKKVNFNRLPDRSITVH